MDNLLLYLLKVSAGTSLLYLCYLLLFRKDTFYLRNRVFLILILLMPAFFPALKIPVETTSVVTEGGISSDTFIFSETSVSTNVTDAVKSLDYNRLLTIIYFTVAGLLLLRVIISLISTYRIIKKGTVRENKFPKVVISDNQLPPFSFFPYAVIPAAEFKKSNYNDLLDHEFAHIRQGHTFDLILSEVFIAFQWFNPFMWLIKRSIVLNHEYLADHVSLSNKSVKDYQYRLLNFQPGLRHISLAHNFNSLIKNRIIMINKKPTRKYAALKSIIILPVVAFLAYSFATPEYRSVPAVSDPLTIYETPAIIQQEVKGIVLKEDGKPLEGVDVTNTGTMGNAFIVKTDKNGRFSIANIQSDATLFFYCKGYKNQKLKADFTKEMVVKMEKDPETKVTAQDPKTGTFPPQATPDRLVVIDGVISDKTLNSARTDLGYNMGIGKMLMGKEATDKYGEKGANGVYEITTRKKALEMGLKPPFPRLGPQDLPTFQDQPMVAFTKWVVENAKYPAEAQEKKAEGWVSINFTIELDGSLSNIVTGMSDDKLLSDEIVRVVKSSPKWDRPKNPDVDEPFPYNVTLKFKLPDQIFNDAPFVIVEQMPKYPGGDKELLNFIKNNTKYPDELKAEKIEGRVIIRFVVSTEGKVEGISVLKGLHPLMDAEAVRVISMSPKWNPGMQGGKPINVWYMAPVNFSLSTSEKLFTKTSETEILKFIGMNAGYPQEAKAAADTGSVYVVLKLQKGGTIKNCEAFTDKKDVKAPFLPEVVIVGYKPSAVQNTPEAINPSGKEHSLLKAESLRVVNNLTVNEIPDWADKDLEFAVTIKFTLK